VAPTTDVAPPSFGQLQLEAGQACWRESQDLRRAVQHFDAAMKWALEHGASELWDRAFCNRCALDIEAGEAGEALTELREIVLRSRDPETGFLASYHLATAYDLAGDPKRARFYANIARDRADRLERADYQVGSYNQIGNLLLADSQFEEACSEYEQALRLLPPAPSVELALVLDNLGYCRLMQGRHPEALELLHRSLRMLVRLRVVRPQAFTRLALCYAHLDLGRYRSALNHGMRALEIATSCDDPDSVKYALFLLGEVHNQLGNDDLAYEHFCRLQQRFYPNAPNVPSVLMALDVRSLINLKA
jgi:tetratricopeptide (TPR) repeat protein